MKNYQSLQETLSYYGVESHKPYYISSGNPVLKFPREAFRTDFYLFCLCTSGEIAVEIDHHRHDIGQDEFSIFAPSTILRILQPEKTFRMRLLFFDKNFLLKNISNPFFIERLSLFRNSNYSLFSSGQEQVDRLKILLSYLEQQAGREGRFVDDIIRTIILNLLLEVASVAEDRTTTKKEIREDESTLFFRFRKLVQDHAATRKDVFFYADRMSVTSKYLIQIVKKATGRTPHEIVDDALLKEAFVLLDHPDKTIAQIAFELGFSSTSSFGRFFKKHVSVSPKEYRLHLPS